jgi:hypothetical protein
MEHQEEKMRKWLHVGCLLALLCALMAVGPFPMWAQDDAGGAQQGQQATLPLPPQAAPDAQQAAPRPPWLFIGPRVGVGGEIAQPSDFNDSVQRLFPSGNSYFPVYSQLGVDVAERIPLAETGYHLFFNQLFTVSGLDQNYALPVFSLLLGAMTPFGLEAALGPQLELANSGSGSYVAPSIVYALGWRFSVDGISIPLTLFVNPLPPTRWVRLTVLAGVDYGFSPSRPKPPTPPFNY